MFILITLKTSVTEYMSSGPTPSPGIKVHLVRDLGLDTGACCKLKKTSETLIHIKNLLTPIYINIIISATIYKLYENLNGQKLALKINCSLCLYQIAQI